jgi:hypothetical protein
MGRPVRSHLAPGTRRPRRCLLTVEALEDRTLPSNYTATTLAELITDIGLANQAGGTNTITLGAGPGSTYTLFGPNNTTDGATGLPVIRPGNDLTIVGNGAIIQRSPTTGAAFRLFDVASGAKLTLQNLTLQNGWAFGSGVSARGGAIYSEGFLTLNGVNVRNSTAQDLTLTGTSHRRGGDAFGGGLYVAGVAGTATLIGVTLSGNLARGGDDQRLGRGGNAFGGGLYVGGNALATLTNVTLNGNLARGGNGSGGINGHAGDGSNGGNAVGGGLYVAGGVGPTAAIAILRNVTLSGNSAQGGAGGAGGDGEHSGGKGGDGGYAVGGGLFVDPGTLFGGAGGTAWLINTLIAQNTLTAGAGGSGGQIRFTQGYASSGSAGGIGAPDVFGSVNFSDHNLVGDGTGSNLSAGVNGNQVGTSASPINPLLGPLQDNGGPTPTMALLPHSPAIDAGNSLPRGCPPPTSAASRASAAPPWTSAPTRCRCPA